MKIAVYHNLSSGGAKRTLREVTRRLARSHQIDLYTLSTADQQFADLREFVNQVHLFPFRPLPLLDSPLGRLNQLSRLVDLFRLDALCSRIAGRIEQEGYDVLLVYPCQLEQGSSILSHVTRTPTVYYCQEPPRRLYEVMPRRPYDHLHARRRQRLNRLDPLPAAYLHRLRQVDRRNTRAADRLLVNSHFMRGEVQKIYDVEAHVSYHGVDAELFQPPARREGSFVLSVGSMTPLKGFDFLIEAIAALPGPRRPPLVVASNFQNPPEKQYLQQLAAAKGVEFKPLHNVSDAQLVRLYGEAALVAYAPVREPFGLVPLEAMACSTPVVGVREGGVPETIDHEETGLLVERDAAGFGQAIGALLDDPVRGALLGENGRRHVLDRWQWDRAAATLAEHLSLAITPPGDRMNRPVRARSNCHK